MIVAYIATIYVLLIVIANELSSFFLSCSLKNQPERPEQNCCEYIHVGIPHIFSASHSHPNIYEFFLFYIIFSLILLIEYKIIIKINKYYQSIKSTLFFSSFGLNV